MPLHLLGKKSWNVYNADNIERVRRDEAAAKAAEEAEEQRMQEVDAERRLAILRGETPPPLPAEPEKEDAEGSARYPRARSAPGGRRKRKRAGEDDTEYELRLARESRLESASQHPDDNGDVRRRKPTSSAPITDRSGHIDLLGDDKARARVEKNEEAEAEAEKERQKLTDQYTMRLANAAGRDSLGKNPWYSQSDETSAAAQPQPMKDVWGNDDPKRRERDSRRIASSDPLAMMKKGATQVRELKRERRKFQAEREEELRQLRREQRRSRRHDGRDGSPRGTSSRRYRSRDREGSDRHRLRRRSSHRDREEAGEGEEEERRHHHRQRRSSRRDDEEREEEEEERRRHRRRSRSPLRE
ncbi:Cir N [Geosmithia morbida]|uniref:Cir N n=1 Tax=Geosmithia morbida TaxID=1094350 RepID=A0A9P4Z2N6_9HYPO|nr:Cir N [Geosmithia morbida]KAF4126371.1 Cir N [Geosmithia morbida]